jgi:hypothetical protein
MPFTCLGGGKTRMACVRSGSIRSPVKRREIFCLSKPMERRMYIRQWNRLNLNTLIEGTIIHYRPKCSAIFGHQKHKTGIWWHRCFNNTLLQKNLHMLPQEFHFRGWQSIWRQPYRFRVFHLIIILNQMGQPQLGCENIRLTFDQSQQYMFSLRR